MRSAPRRVAALTPYQPVGDEQVRRFLEESGYTVTNVVGLKCDTATSIAHTPPREVIDAVLNELDGDNVDCHRAGRHQSLHPGHLPGAGTAARQAGDPDQYRDNLARVPRPRHRGQDFRPGLVA